MLILCKNRQQIRRTSFSHAGFSLVELMVAVAVIGILAVFALPSYTIWIENTRIRNAADSINSGLQKARVEALKRNADVKFEIGVGSDWTIGCVNVTADCPDTIEERRVKEGSSASISVTATPVGSTILVFTSLGRVRSALEGAPEEPFTQLDIDNSSMSGSESRDLRILIDAGGAGKMCDPYTGLSDTDPRKCPA
ncbi:GspH/FimT family pseudopilin [Methylotenera mobilis]|jgi:type IV fimbrial biogenesis protein FimT|uniref:GspH/FimT family pseudopilin n=1 Tax=Methylotenera mobilis TaxID=359408 RepID=UPI0003698163|nr:GspH/FimT family pseudopilin [Methylotenera mobilis]PPC97668.1 MAG: prepilin-type cleavage/methylation domain-containing protein [Methylotenera sp.]